jgi:hypothetical protein
LIGDDASEDATLEIATAFAATAPFATRTSRNASRLGYVQNFSRLASQASGDILLFCDQDDVWHPDKVARLERYFLDDDKALCVIHDVALIDRRANPLGASLLAGFRDSPDAAHMYVKGCATGLRAELVQAIFPLPPHSGWTHDSIVHVAAAATGTRRVLPDVLLDYRLHGGNTSGFISGRKTFRGRLNAAIDRFEMSAAPPGLHPLPIPKQCTEPDIELLLRAIGRIQPGGPPVPHAMQAYLRGLGSIAATRLESAGTSLPAGLKIAVDKYRSGDFNALGGLKVLMIEWCWIIAKALLRPVPKSSPR